MRTIFFFIICLIFLQLHVCAQDIGSEWTNVPPKKIYLSDGYSAMGATGHSMLFSAKFNRYEPIAGAIYADIIFSLNRCQTYCVTSKTGDKTCAENARDLQFPHYPTIRYISFEYFFLFNGEWFEGTQTASNTIEATGAPIQVMLNVPVGKLLDENGKNRFTTAELVKKIRVTKINIKEITYSDNVIDYFNKLAAFAGGKKVIERLKQDLADAEKKQTINRQLAIAKNIQQFDSKDASNNSKVSSLEVRVAEKEKLLQKFKSISESNFEERLKIRREVSYLDPNDVENNVNMKNLEDAISTNKEAQKRKDDKAFDKKMHDAAVEQNAKKVATTGAYYPPPKTTEQIISEGATKIANILIQARAERRAYEEEQKLKKQREFERKEQETKNLQRQKWDKIMDRARRADDNPNDARAWREALQVNTKRSFGNYLDKYGVNGVYGDVAGVFYNAWNNDKEDLNYKIRWAVGWSNWKLVLHLIELGADPNVEWYLDNGVYDGSILSRITNLRGSIEQLGLTKSQFVAYLISKGLDFSKGNFFYEYQTQFDDDFDMEVLNALIRSGKFKAEIPVGIFIMLFDEAFGKKEGSRNMVDFVRYNRAKRQNTIYYAGEITDSDIKSLTGTQIEEYRNFFRHYLKKIIEELKPDRSAIISRRSVWYAGDILFLSELFRLPTEEHLNALDFIVSLGFKIDHFRYVAEELHRRFAGGAYTMSGSNVDHILLHKYFEFGLDPTDHVFKYGKKSLIKKWKDYNRNDLVKLWEDFKDERKSERKDAAKQYKEQNEETFLLAELQAVINLHSQKKYDPAIKQLNGLIKKHDDNHLLYTLRASCKTELNDHAGALKDYDEALKLKPNDTALLNGSAWSKAMLKKDLNKAEQQIKIAIETSPYNYSYIDTYAFILQQQNKYAEARKQYEIALELGGKKNVGILERYGDVLYQLKDEEGAFTQWKKAKTLGGNTSAVLDNKIYTINSTQAITTASGVKNVSSNIENSKELTTEANSRLIVLANEKQNKTLQVSFKQSADSIQMKLDLFGNGSVYIIPDSCNYLYVQVSYGTKKEAAYFIRLVRGTPGSNTLMVKFEKSSWNKFYYDINRHMPSKIKITEFYWLKDDIKESYALTEADALKFVTMVTEIGKK